MKIYACGHKAKTKYKRVVNVPYECKRCETPDTKRLIKALRLRVG